MPLQEPGASGTSTKWYHEEIWRIEKNRKEPICYFLACPAHLKSWLTNKELGFFYPRPSPQTSTISESTSCSRCCCITISISNGSLSIISTITLGKGWKSWKRMEKDGKGFEKAKWKNIKKYEIDYHASIRTWTFRDLYKIISWRDMKNRKGLPCTLEVLTNQFGAGLFLPTTITPNFHHLWKHKLQQVVHFQWEVAHLAHHPGRPILAARPQEWKSSMTPLQKHVSLDTSTKWFPTWWQNMVPQES